MLRRFTRTSMIAATGLLATVLLTAGLLTPVLSAPAVAAANPVTPGNFTGLGFDQCATPSQTAMSAWLRSSPFRAAGIYISGNSRACRTQTNLTPTWVANQLRTGWHLMPITLGPQASCSTRFPRYGASIDPTIVPSATGTYSAARTQGALEARRAVNAAKALGIVYGSTLFYDLEAFNTKSSTTCTWSALWFLNSWTQELHRYHYASGVYSSAASGIRVLDDARVRAGNQIALPDQIWVADWNKQANTSSTYIRSDGWLPYRRAHQYQGGHNETWGGVRINIDRSFVALRTPAIAGATTTSPATPVSAPPASTSDPRCTTASVSKTLYRRTNARHRSWLYTPLQCVLKQQRRYTTAVTGRWSGPTLSAMRNWQKSVGHRVRYSFTRGDWVTALAMGNSGKTLRAGSTGADVIRLQRALNAAGSPKLRVNGIFGTTTAAAVGGYQKRVGISPTRIVAAQTWAALRAGRL
jgi:hypothetical protein